MSRLKTLLKMMMLPGPMGNLRRSANLEGITSGWALVRDVWDAAKKARPEETDQSDRVGETNVVNLRTDTFDPAIRRAIGNSWRNCWLLLAFGSVYMIALLAPALLHGRMPTLSALVDTVLAGLLFGIGYLRQALGNWRLRRGRTGSLAQFLRAGRAAWPRRYR